LGELGLLISQARVLVCNDTGVSHIAAAFRTPSVILFSASDPGRWQPFERRLHRAICAARKTPPEKVIAEIDLLIHQTGVYAKSTL
jgi:ADP-heptose:LPS heptosyltransferase